MSILLSGCMSNLLFAVTCEQRPHIRNSSKTLSLSESAIEHGLEEFFWCRRVFYYWGVHNWVYVTSIVLSYNAKSSAAFHASLKYDKSQHCPWTL